MVENQKYSSNKLSFSLNCHGGFSNTSAQTGFLSLGVPGVGNKVPYVKELTTGLPQNVTLIKIEGLSNEKEEEVERTRVLSLKSKKQFSLHSSKPISWDSHIFSRNRLNWSAPPTESLCNERAF